MGNRSQDESQQNIKVAFFLNLAFTIFEFLGGLYTNSVAILSDAVHDLGDSLSLGTAWYMGKKASQKPDKQFSFGYSRFSLLGALINSIVLIVGSIYMVNEAITRIIHPEPSDAQGMLLFAFVGIAVNGYAAWKMSKGKSLNEKVVSWHLLEDVLGWVAILVVAVVLQFKQIEYLDPAVSLLISLYILRGVAKRLKETLYLFLQGVPKELSVASIEQEILKIPQIESIHHTRLWSMDGERHIFTTHLKLKGIKTTEQIPLVKANVKEVLKPYQFAHYTIETELSGESCLTDEL